jgi:ribA/ribD-fused uncharacterized protein
MRIVANPQVNMKQIQNYSREQLVEQIDRGAKFEYLLFYGHKESVDGSVTAACCSQWFTAKFRVDGIEYLTAEQFMMAEKARLFNDAESLEKILNSETPAEAKALGRKVVGFDEEVWKANCFDIVVAANKAKFSQNVELGKWLLATAPKVLVEASPRDRIWGIGMGASNPEARNPSLWRGRNLLGFALMAVRDSLV